MAIGMEGRLPRAFNTWCRTAHHLTNKNSCVTKTMCDRICRTQRRRRCRRSNLPHRGGSCLSPCVQLRPTSHRQIGPTTLGEQPTRESRDKNKEYLRSDSTVENYVCKKRSKVNDSMYGRVRGESRVGSWYVGTSLARVAVASIGTSAVLFCPCYAKGNLHEGETGEKQTPVDPCAQAQNPADLAEC